MKCFFRAGQLSMCRSASLTLDGSRVVLNDTLVGHAVALERQRC